MDTPYSESSSQSEAPVPAQDMASELRPVGKGFITLYTLAQFGMQMVVTTPIALTLALRAQQLDPAHKATDLSLLLGLGAFIALIVQPIVGLLSDRTTSRFGRRRPWMVAGTIGGSLALVGVAFAPNFPLLLLGWCLVQLIFNMNMLGAILPDQVPEQQRGKVSGLGGMAGPLGGIAGILIEVVTGSVALSFVGTAICALVLILTFAFFLPDRRLEKKNKAPLDLSSFASSFWINPRRYPDFAWVWAGRFLVVCGLAMFTNYQVYYLTDHLHIPTAQVSSLVAILSGLGIVFTMSASIVGGILSDRLKRRKIFVLMSALIYGVGILIIAFASSLPIFLIGAMVGNLALGVYLAVDGALVTDVLPNRETEAAKGMGIFGIAQSLPQSLAPAIAPLFLAIGGGNNYVALYFAAALITLIGALTIRPIKSVR